MALPLQLMQLQRHGDVVTPQNSVRLWPSYGLWTDLRDEKLTGCEVFSPRLLAHIHLLIQPFPNVPKGDAVMKLPAPSCSGYAGTIALDRTAKY